MTKHIDVVIVGAGPAGLAAGIVFAQNSFQTLILEKKRLPIDKACGEGVLPPGTGHLESLGVSKYLKPEDYSHFVGIYYRSPGGYEASAKFKNGPAWGITRRALSSAFRSRINELDHLEIREEVRVKKLNRHAGRIWVEADGEIFSTRLLVGADGINSTVRKWAGLDGPAPSIWRWGVRQHFSISPWSDFVEVHWKDGVEAYITPCGLHCVGIAFLINRDRFDHFPPGKQLFPSLIHDFPVIDNKLRGANAIDSPLSTGPLRRNAASTVSDGVILIGDAAGYIDAITGDGISLALAQAQALEQTVMPVLSKQGSEGDLLSTEDLSNYASVHNNLVGPHNRMTNLVLLLVRFPSLVDPVIAVLGKYPKLFQRLIS